MNKKIPDYSDLWNPWKTNKWSEERIRQQLVSEGFKSDQVEEAMAQYKKKQNNARLFTGFMGMGAGAFIGFLSCIFAVLDFAPAWRSFFLYGLTSVSVLLAMAGCYLVLERPANDKRSSGK